MECVTATAAPEQHRVLVIDDEPNIADVVSIALRFQGFAVECACIPGQLRQVLSNLMRNALVHTPAGTPIEVSVRAGGRELVLEVRDHGPGLPSGDPAELFERFWRGTGPTRPRGRGRAGAGLGLSIVAAVVSAHGGRAVAADAEGVGARFTVTLPALVRDERSGSRGAAGVPLVGDE